MNDEIMDKIIEKCKEDPKYAEVFDHLLRLCQSAAQNGFTNDELAHTCLMGWMIGMDSGLGEMIKAMSKISKMGLDIVED
jgi:hypothetical protein